MGPLLFTDIHGPYRTISDHIGLERTITDISGPDGPDGVNMDEHGRTCRAGRREQAWTCIDLHGQTWTDRT